MQAQSVATKPSKVSSSGLRQQQLHYSSLTGCVVQKQKVGKGGAGFTDQNAAWLKPKAGKQGTAKKSKLLQELQEGEPA